MLQTVNTFLASLYNFKAMNNWRNEFTITKMGQLTAEAARRGEYDKVCDDCKKYGKCRLKLSKAELQYFEEQEREKAAIEAARQAAANREKNRRAFTMDNLSIANLTPLHAENNWQNQPFRKNLQTAYEAFHHKDYESAILNYKAVLEKDPINVTALEGISVAYYFIGNLKAALIALQEACDNLPNGQYLWFLKFKLHIQNRMKDEEEYFSFAHDELPEESNVILPKEKNDVFSILLCVNS